MLSCELKKSFFFSGQFLSNETRMVKVLLFFLDPKARIEIRDLLALSVFLLGASGCTGRFFTQLLFHNPHSTQFLFKVYFTIYCGIVL